MSENNKKSSWGNKESKVGHEMPRSSNRGYVDKTAKLENNRKSDTSNAFMSKQKGTSKDSRFNKEKSSNTMHEMRNKASKATTKRDDKNFIHKKTYQINSENEAKQKPGSYKNDFSSKPVKAVNRKNDITSDKNSRKYTEAKVNLKNGQRNLPKDYSNENKNPARKSRRQAVADGACPYIRECGSCQMMRQSYEEHLIGKQKQVDSLIKKYCKVEPIIGMKEPKHYRNKVHAVFDHDRKGNPISGIYEEGTHRVIPIDHCLIHNKKADEIINSIRGLLKSFKIKTYDEDTEYGLLRHVLIRTGFTSGEIMVVLVLSSPILPSKNNFVKALRQLHPEITTIVLNVNDKRTSMVLGEKEHVLYGKGYIEDTLCGKVFRISPKSFYQVNPVQTEVIYNKAIKLAGLKGTETVIDAYCGIGTIGLIASDHVKRVIGVELNKDAVRDAVTNARRNQINNVEFYNNDAGVFMSQLAEANEKIDVVFLDPPRSGSDEQFLNSLVTLKPEKVVYISCNPVTLERDLGYLTKKGYKANIAAPVDMFPWTEHVETCVLLTR